MARTPGGSDEPEGAVPSREVAVRITVPEEFIGSAIRELEARQGYVTEMNALVGAMTIKAFVPGSEYDRLSQEIVSATLKRGTVERDIPADRQ